ncbi:MAG: hypothetical protein M3Q79_00205 [bacterium]|nr:hypothetical protein [bacterium]
MQQKPFTFDGLPIPDDFEAMMLTQVMAGDTDLPSPEFLADLALQVNPSLERMLHFVVNYYIDNNDFQDDPNIIIESSHGLEHGFNLALGTFAFIGYLRSGEDRPQEFIYNFASVLPPKNDREKQRFQTVLAGNAPVQPCEYAPDLTSSDLPASYMGDYFFDALPIENLLLAEQNIIHGAISDAALAESYTSGMRVGFESMIGLLVESEQQRVLDNAYK